MTNKKIKIEFAPGCFDNFDGTQEELDDLMAKIQEMADSGELQEQATLVDPLELFTEEELNEILGDMSDELIEDIPPKNRTLH